MRKFSVFILAILLIAITFSFTSCQFDLNRVYEFDFDQYCDDVVVSVFGEDSAFAQQIANFEFLMQTKSFAKMFGDALAKIGATIAAIDFGDVESIVVAVFAVIANCVAWLVVLVVCVIGIYFIFIIDLILMVAFFVVFIFLWLIYAFNGLLALFFGLFV